MDETEESVCRQGSTYTIAIPVRMDFQVAENICRVSNGRFPAQGSLAALEAYTTWYYKITGGKCPRIWTSFSDAEKEGTFVNLDNGREAEYLPWKSDQPNDGTYGNNVMIQLPEGRYVDINAHWLPPATSTKNL